jgi:hypothetical protein
MIFEYNYDVRHVTGKVGKWSTPPCSGRGLLRGAGSNPVLFNLFFRLLGHFLFPLLSLLLKTRQSYSSRYSIYTNRDVCLWWELAASPGKKKRLGIDRPSNWSVLQWSDRAFYTLRRLSHKSCIGRRISPRRLSSSAGIYSVSRMSDDTICHAIFISNIVSYRVIDKFIIEFTRSKYRLMDKLIAN